MPGCPCNACQRVDFDVIDPKTSTVVGKLSKVGRGCAKNALLGDYNSFQVEFPKSQSWTHKALLMTCAIFIDYMQFDKQNQKGKNKSSSSGGGGD